MESDIMKYMSFDELVVNLPEDMSCVGINLGGQEGYGGKLNGSNL